MAERPSLHSQPNITPLIDVLLVLLIMFLCSVRLSQTGIDLFLPSEAGHRSPHGVTEVVLDYSAERKITINSQPVARAELGRLLREIYSDRRDKTMWLSGAGSLRYGEIVEVIDTAKGAGVQRVGVITPEAPAARARREVAERERAGVGPREP